MAITIQILHYYLRTTVFCHHVDSFMVGYQINSTHDGTEAKKRLYYKGKLQNNRLFYKG